MLLLGTTPTQAAHNWSTEYSADITKASPALLRPLDDTMPTLRILLDNQKAVNGGDGYGPLNKSYYDIEHQVYSPSRGAKKQVYTFPDIDPLTQSEWTPEIWWNSAGTDMFELADYGRKGSLYNLAERKVDAIHLGNTLYFNYAIFSNHNETISGNELDIESIMSTAGRRIPYPIKFKSVSDESQMIRSIPTLCRLTTLGHTLGNIATGTTGATANKFWQPKVTVPTGAAITQNTTAGHNNIDTCIDDDTTTVPLTMDIISEHLHDISVGHKLYAPCGWKVYNFLRNQILAEQRRIISSQGTYLTADLGINNNITLEEFNTVFYLEPMMTTMWPASIFFFDPDCLFIEYDPLFNPKVQEWEKISGTDMEGTVVTYRHNLVRPDAQGVSAIHGVTDES